MREELGDVLVLGFAVLSQTDVVGDVQDQRHVL